MGMYFDGSTYLTGPSLVSTGYSSTKLLLNLWFKSGDDTPTQGYLIRESGAGGGVGNLWVRQETNGRIVANVYTSAGASIANLDSVSTYGIADGWNMLTIAIDTVAGFAKMFVNLVQKASATPSASAVIDLEGAGWNLASRVSGSNKFTGDLDQVYLSNNFTTDYVSATGELTAKFIAEMVDLDANGTIYRKTESIAASAGVPFILLESKTYSTFTTNTGSSVTAWTISAGQALPPTDTGHIGTYTFTG